MKHSESINIFYSQQRISVYHDNAFYFLNKMHYNQTDRITLYRFLNWLRWSLDLGGHTHLVHFPYPDKV